MLRAEELPIFETNIETVDFGRIDELPLEYTKRLADLGIIDEIKRIIDILVNFKFAYGSFDTPKLGWYRVRYEAFSEPPTVVAISEWRGGWFEPVPFDKEKYALEVEESFRKLCYEKLSGGLWEVPPGSWIRDGVCWVFKKIGYVAGWTAALMGEVALNNSPNLMYAFSMRPQMKLTTCEVRYVEEDNCQILGYENSRVHCFIIGKR